MEIGVPTNVTHVSHVTFDRFDGFLGLPDEFEPEVPRKAPSASANVFGVSTESMQLSFDSRGNSVPTILLHMQTRLYAQGGLQTEGIFRINAENSQEEYVRDQLNGGVVPNGVDIHCLAGLIKAWFRELPTGLLDSLSPDQVSQSHSEEECAQLVRQLPPTEAALLDWAINLMADVAQLEHVNKMNARNVALVFAPNMTKMSDPLTALKYAVQMMNFLKSLITKTLRERKESGIEPSTASLIEPSIENPHHSSSQPVVEKVKSTPDDSTAETRSKHHANSIENFVLGENVCLIDSCPQEDVSKDDAMIDRCPWDARSQLNINSKGHQDSGFTSSSHRAQKNTSKITSGRSNPKSKKGQ